MRRVNKGINNIIRISKIVINISKCLFLLLIISNIVIAATPFINVLFSKWIIDAYIVGKFDELIFYASLAISLNVVFLMIRAILEQWKKKESYYFELQFEKLLSSRIVDFSIEDVSSNYVKELQLNIEQGKMRGIQPSSMLTLIERILQNGFSLILAMLSFIQIFTLQNEMTSISFWTGPWALIILLCLIVVVVVVSFTLQVKMNTQITELYQAANEANGSAFAYMQMISDPCFGKDIRYFQIKDFLCDAFEELWKSSIGYNLLKKIGKKKALIPCVSALCNGFLDVFAYLLVIMKAVMGEISIGSIVLYIGSIRIFMQSILELVNNLSELIGLGELLEPCLEMLKIKTEDVQKGGIIEDSKKWELRFENVSFRYPDENKWVLQDISFQISEGEHIALVGVNGSGKSTIVKLLCRFYEPQKGRITLNGVDIRELNIDWYRQRINSVFQDFSIPPFQLGQVIACNDKYESLSVINVLKSYGFVNSSPEVLDLDTWLYKRFEGNGIEISGGEAQKIAIARAYYKAGKLLIMDEPTAALDPRTEAEIYGKIAKIETTHTMIFISHRMSSCKMCKKILVLDEGRLVQAGSHQELVEKPGRYQEMWKAQAQFYA